jgi:DNA-binding response OmpR family regulator
MPDPSLYHDQRRQGDRDQRMNIREKQLSALIRGEECPNCQMLQARIDMLERDMKTFVPRKFRLTATETKIMGALLKWDTMSAEALMDVVYGALDMEPEIGIMRVFITKIRNKLCPFGISIGTEWGHGYFISAEHKAKVAELLETKVTA